MIRTTLRIDGQRYALTQDQDVAELQSAARDAARSGGDFIEVRVAGDETVAVLVTPGLPMVFEKHNVPPDDQTEVDPAAPLATDLDFDL